MLTQAQIDDFKKKAKSAGYSDDEIAREVFRKRMEVEGVGEQPEFKPEKNATNFIYNVDQDARKIAGGMAQLPGAVGYLAKNPTQIPGAAVDVAKGVVKSYADLITHPIETTYNRPVETFMNLLPVAGAANKAAKAGKMGAFVQDPLRLAGQADDVVRFADDAAAVGKAADKVDDATSRVLSGLDQTDEMYKSGRVARKVYQGQFPFSKKGNSFERLNPAQTADEMVYYGISGTKDDIAKTTRQITGRNGVLSRVVNEAVSDADTGIDVSKAQQYLNDISSSQYSSLDPAKIDDLKVRFAGVKPGDKINTVTTSKLLDFERTMQKEGFADLLKGQRTQNAAAEELGRIKLGLADEIGGLIDDGVDQMGTIEKFKNPKVYDALKQISPRLADDYMNAKTVSELRALQKPFVRMSQIIALSEQEASSLGNNFLRWVRSIPGVGTAVDVVADELVTPAITKGAVAADRFKNTAAAGAVANAARAGVGAVKGTAKTGKNVARSAMEATPDLKYPAAAQLDELSLADGAPAIQTTSDTKSQMVTIRNKQTGEVKQVSQAELPQYMGDTSEQRDGVPTKEQIDQAMVEDLATTGGKNITKLKTLSDSLYPDQSGEKTKSSTQVKLEAMATSGVRSAKKAQDMLNEDPSILLKQKAPGSLLTREFDSALFNAVDAILRMRTGAQAPEKEVRRYMTIMGPSLGDSNKVAKEKLQSIMDELQYVLDNSQKVQDYPTFEGGQPVF